MKKKDYAIFWWVDECGGFWYAQESIIGPRGKLELVDQLTLQADKEDVAGAIREAAEYYGVRKSRIIVCPAVSRRTTKKIPTTKEKP